MRLNKKKCTSQSCRAHLFFRSAFYFPLFLCLFPQKYTLKDAKDTMILNNKLIKICTLSYISLVSSSTKNQISYFTLEKGCDRLKLDTSADGVKKMKTNKQTNKQTNKNRTKQNKQTKKKNKTHAALVFQSVTNF